MTDLTPYRQFDGMGEQQEVEAHISYDEVPETDKMGDVGCCSGAAAMRERTQSMAEIAAVTCWNQLTRALWQIPSILLGTAFAILDNVPYGLLIFHGGDKSLMALGATMVLESTITAQAAFSALSVFPFAVGACNVENVPFLSAMSRSITFQMTQKHMTQDHILSTIIMAFTLATLSTGLAFWVLGRLKVGSFTDFMPKHVLLGCISGMGFFIVFAAIGVAAGTTWAWDVETIQKVFEPRPLLRWSITVALEVFLLSVSPKVNSILFVPCFLLMTPVVFYICLYYAGVSVAEARAAGWLFDLLDYASPSEGPRWKIVLQNFIIWRRFSIRAVDWNVVGSQMTTIMAIVFFSVIHAPLNVPALSLQTNVQADLDREFKVHAAGNLLSSFFGGAQSYMTYSSSSLLATCGMVDRWASMSVAVLSSIFIAVGPAVALSYFPLPAAAIFLMHVGMVLVKDGVVESFAELDAKEYFVVWVIAIAMQWNFMQGLAIGAVVSVFTFLLHLSRLEVASMPVSGRGLTSNQLRPRKERELLRSLMGQLRVLRLRGNVFFGNAQQLLDLVRRVYEDQRKQRQHIRFLMVDFSRVIDIDCTAVDKFSTIAQIAHSNGSVLIFAGMGDVIIERASCWQSDGMKPSQSTPCCNEHVSKNQLADVEDEEPVRFFGTISSAIYWCEEQLLFTERKETLPMAPFLEIAEEHYAAAFPALNAASPDLQLVIRNDSPDSLHPQLPPEALPSGPGIDHWDANDSKTLSDFDGSDPSLVQLLRLVSDDAPEGQVSTLASFFEVRTFDAGAILWRESEPSTFMCVVRTGHLGVEWANAAPKDSIPPRIDELEVSSDGRPFFPSNSQQYKLLTKKESMGRTRNRRGSVGSFCAPEQARIFTSSPLSPTMNSINRCADLWQCLRPPVVPSDSIHSSTSQAVMPSFVVDHPVWNKTVCIHRTAYEEYYAAGHFVGEVTTFVGVPRGSTVVSVDSSTVWVLTDEVIRQLRVEHPEVALVLQSIVLSSAWQRLGNSSRLHQDTLLV